MELGILGFLFLFGYFFLRLGALFFAWVTGGRTRSFRHLAALTRGRYESRGLGSPPTVSFTRHGAQVRVGLAPPAPGWGYEPRTRVVARWNQGQPLRLELAPTGRPAPPQPPQGMRPVSLGDPAFDSAYIVQANDPEMACAFLVPSIRAALDRLHHMGPRTGMFLSINRERMLVQVDRNLAVSTDALLAAVNEAMMVLDGLAHGVAARIGQGIAIVQVGPAAVEDAGPPICRVCGEAIGSPSVVCVSCRAPHHRDCWEFVGSCSIFGCNGKQSLSA